MAGEWAGRRDADDKPRETRCVFYPDGRYLFLLTILQLTGTYSIQGSTLRVKIPDSAVREFRHY